MRENTYAPNIMGTFCIYDVDDVGFSEEENSKISSSELWWLNLTLRKIKSFTLRVCSDIPIIFVKNGI